jgi:hypothetical protein
MAREESAGKDAKGSGRDLLWCISQRSSGGTSKITKTSRGIPSLRIHRSYANCTQFNDVQCKPAINLTESLNQPRVDKQNELLQRGFSKALTLPTGSHYALQYEYSPWAIFLHDETSDCHRQDGRTSVGGDSSQLHRRTGHAKNGIKPCPIQST